MVINRHGAWLAAAAAFGTLVLPALVYFTGIAVLGRYAAGGLGAFYADFLTDLARLRWHAWTLALGPLVAVAIWRVFKSRSRCGTA